MAAWVGGMRTSSKSEVSSPMRLARRSVGVQGAYGLYGCASAVVLRTGLWRDKGVIFDN
jgi:hypothetical protein